MERGTSIISLEVGGSNITPTISQSNAGAAWVGIPTAPVTLPNFVTTSAVTLGADQRFTVFTPSTINDYFSIGTGGNWNDNTIWTQTVGERLAVARQQIVQ